MIDGFVAKMFTLLGYFVPLLTFVFQRDTPKQDLLSCKCGLSIKVFTGMCYTISLEMLETY